MFNTLTAAITFAHTSLQPVAEAGDEEGGGGEEVVIAL